MPRLTRFSSFVAAATLAFGGIALVAPAAHADTYNPPEGARVNNPDGDTAAKLRIKRHIVRTIYSVPAGGILRVASWNLSSNSIIEALERAHEKGVTVQVIMQYDNAYEHDPDPNNPIAAPGQANPGWWEMKKIFSEYGNSSRPSWKRSWARLCKSSCRGTSGLAHTKMLIANKVYRTPYVVQYGSANMTDAAASIQWNDWYTIAKSKALYQFATARFMEMAKDRPVAQPWRHLRDRGVDLGFFPWAGTGTQGDPVMRALRPVQCSGAATGYGTSYHHTIVRVSQTAMDDARGRTIAYRLKDLYNNGCNVKVLYSLMGPKIKAILRSSSGRGPVPIHQLAVDTNGDLVYDKYLHQKVLLVDGKYNNDTSTTLTWNGSANIAGYTLASDETFTRLSSLTVEHFYENWIDAWFNRNARYARVADGATSSTDTTSDNVDEKKARAEGIDPYAKISLN